MLSKYKLFYQKLKKIDMILNMNDQQVKSRIFLKNKKIMI